MDALTLLLQLFFRSFVILLPVVVGWLAFRRLALSKTSNAWIYAVTCLFAAVITAGLLPWAVGLAASNWIFFVLAAFCPAIWFGVTTICDFSGQGKYEPEIAEFSSVLFKASRKKPKPLLLSDPLSDLTVPLFSHSAPANTDAPSLLPVVTETPKAMGEKSVLEVAREMRRNKSSDERRIKLLPAPSMDELAFVKASRSS